MQIDNQIKETSADVQAAEAEKLAAAPQTASQTARWYFVRSLLKNAKAVIGGGILLFFVLMAVFAPLIASGDPKDFVSRPHQEPSAEFIFGTDGQGRDVFAQTVHGARISLTVGLVTGVLATILGIIVGMSAGYFGGRVDDVLSLLTNLVLIIPGLPLLVIIASFLKPGPTTIIFVLTITAWAWPARVMRAQTLSLREKDFVSASLVSGESQVRVIFREILPNMTSIIVGSMFGTTIFAIGADTGLSFLGLTNVSDVSWGTNLYWAQNNAGLLVGAWWTFIPSGLCVALVAFAFALINYAMDEITNPRLRAEKEIAHVFKKRSNRSILATSVIRS
jgi:peptide/nickel transport system permease protein